MYQMDKLSSNDDKKRLKSFNFNFVWFLTKHRILETDLIATVQTIMIAAVISLVLHYQCNSILCLYWRPQILTKH